MRTFYFTLSLLCLSLFINAQSFEGSSIPSNIKANDGKSDITLSTKYYKDGTKSMNWNWKQSNAVLRFTDSNIASTNDQFGDRGGIKFWVCTEEPYNKPLTFNFKDASNTTQYTFKFYLNFTGWRAGWIAYSDMWTPSGGQPTKKNITSLEIISPEGISNGNVWFDRMEFSRKVDMQATPDAQIPENNRFLSREMWHWGLLHDWEQTAYDIPLPTSLTAEQEADMQTVYNNLKNNLKRGTLNSADKTNLQELIKKLAISSDGTKGAPLMQKDNMKSGDVKYDELENLLDLSARGWYMDNNASSKREFLKAIRYMLHQGFAYESGMGTNHHYGYQIRGMYGAIWWMEDVLKEEGLWEDALKALTYWSGLQESRLPIDKQRDELTDSWNTLIIARLASALMIDNKFERFRALQGLSRWVNGSLSFTPGTLGGIKVDGTAFHHGGHYPGYSTPGYASIGQYLRMVNGTQFGLNDSAREVLKFALLSVARQTNTHDWGLGASGRHPFSGSINRNCISTFAYAALAFEPIDNELAGEYLRLMEGQKKYTEDLNMIKSIKDKGIEANEYPQGFYVYNYAAQGIYRYNENMVSLKGFNKFIWGAEIYSSDNRYGRYQSYGSIQILGTRSIISLNGGYPVTEKESGYVEEGWDWNRNPGATYITLPFYNLNAPTSGTQMLRQPERFAGASRLEDGKYGMFAMKLGEYSHNSPDFTPSFNAYKSVFCFGNKVICLGSDISNENNNHFTETAIFQQYLRKKSLTIEVDGEKITKFPYENRISKTTKSMLLEDVVGNHYYVPKGQRIEIYRRNQKSYLNKDANGANPKYGDFALAYLVHGKNPDKASYEYMILLDATDAQLAEVKADQTGYTVLQKNSAAHIVKDNESEARGYAVFNNFNSTDDEYIMKSSHETMIMLRPENDKLYMSVCDPDLNLGHVSYTIPRPSQPKTKHILLKNKYTLVGQNDAVTLKYDGEKTVIDVKCVDGIPVEFTLEKADTGIDETADNGVKIYRNASQIVVDTTYQGNVQVFDLVGRKLYEQKKQDNTPLFILLNTNNVIVQFTAQNHKITTKKIIKAH